MPPCQNVPRPIPEERIVPEKPPQDDEEEMLRQLSRTMKIGLTVTLANYLYGHYFMKPIFTKDPRQATWLASQSPLPTLVLSIAFVLGVTWIGPRLMRGRRPCQGLRSFMVAYNAFQVAFSAWIFYEVGMGGWFGTYSLRCQPCDFSDDPKALRMMHATYWFYISKFLDFFDTIFFVLHKKYDHISNLHVCHHSTMPINIWYGMCYQPGGNTTLLGFLNSFVHMVMYGYYLLAAMGPRVRPFLWWKKYVTTLQMVQFIIVILHGAQVTLGFTECPEVPPAMTLWLILNTSVMLLLFMNFYTKSYTKGTRVDKTLYAKVPSKLPPISVAGGGAMDKCEMALRSRLRAI